MSAISHARSATEHHQAAIQMLLEGERLAREQATLGTHVRQAALVSDEVAQAQAAAEKHARVGTAEAGLGGAGGPAGGGWGRELVRSRSGVRRPDT